jgi:hypothetical protein
VRGVRDGRRRKKDVILVADDGDVIGEVTEFQIRKMGKTQIYLA